MIGAVESGRSSPKLRPKSGLMRRRENIAFVRISAIEESRGGGFAEGFDAVARWVRSCERPASPYPVATRFGIWSRMLRPQFRGTSLMDFKQSDFDKKV
jgi:hypothetical protein